MADNLLNWESFEERCASCKACGLYEGRSNIVIFRGARSAPLMIIGEAPGGN